MVAREPAAPSEKVQPVLTQVKSHHGAPGAGEAANAWRSGAMPYLYRLLRAIDDRDVDGVQGVVETWGPLVKDEAKLWAALGG